MLAEIFKRNPAAIFYLVFQLVISSNLSKESCLKDHFEAGRAKHRPVYSGQVTF